MSTSDFRFFRVPEPSLSVLTVIYHILVSSFRRKVTKPTIIYIISRHCQCQLFRHHLLQVVDIGLLLCGCHDQRISHARSPLSFTLQRQPAVFSHGSQTVFTSFLCCRPHIFQSGSHDSQGNYTQQQLPLKISLFHLQG